MNHPGKVALILSGLFALGSVTALAAPKPKKPVSSKKPIPVKPTKPPVTEIACPMTVGIDQAVRTPAGFHALSGIHNYSYSICSGSSAMFASNASRTISCYYCDNHQTNKVRLDHPFPQGTKQCTRIGTSYRFSCS
jgi:hypothetical protein